MKINKSMPFSLFNSLIRFTLCLIFASPGVLFCQEVTTKTVQAKARQENQMRNENTYPFEFRSGFWINLHHFLYEQAILRKQVKSFNQTAISSAKPNEQLTPEQQRLWDAALNFYANSIIKRDLLKDEEMTRINDQLSESEKESDLSKSGINGDLKKILESVAPVYRAHWWERHDKANRFWIAVAMPLVQQFSQTLIKELSAVYRAKWTSQPIRVDAVEYANWAGAYTTFDRANRVHITIGSMDSGNQGFAALEILFHESSHWMVNPFDGAVAEAIARESKAKNKPIPDGLWHAIIFYTTGEITRRNLNEYGVSDYKPAYYELFTRAWTNYRRPLELYWQPYLEGKVDFDKTMSNLINAL